MRMCRRGNRIHLRVPTIRLAWHRSCAFCQPSRADAHRPTELADRSFLLPGPTRSPHVRARSVGPSRLHADRTVCDAIIGYSSACCCPRPKGPEAAARSKCQNNLKQWSGDAQLPRRYGHFPPGVDITQLHCTPCRDCRGTRSGCCCAPRRQDAIYSKYELRGPAGWNTTQNNGTLGQLPMNLFHLPSDGKWDLYPPADYSASSAPGRETHAGAATVLRRHFSRLTKRRGSRHADGTSSTLPSARASTD